MRLKEMLLEDWRPQDRDTLVAELNERRVPGKAATSGTMRRRAGRESHAA